MNSERARMLNDISDFFSERLAAYGSTPLGVDWNGAESQRLRFDQLSKIIAGEEHFSIADLGCGYGALLEYIKASWSDFSYQGVDITPAMVTAAQSSHGDEPRATFYQSSEPRKMADYVVASGIFNKKQDCDPQQWLNYICDTVEKMNHYSRKGFAFNCLTQYSDKEKMRSDLYYADPCWLFDLCKRRYSRQVALLHDYGAYEFTLLVRKTT